MLSVVGKLYGRMQIRRDRAETDCAIEEEQCRFRQGRWCMDQVFVARQVHERYLANGKRCILDIYGLRKDAYYD